MRTAALLMLAGCYAPSLTTGAPCSGPADCPRDLVCAAASRTCERSDVDAAVDAPPIPDGCWGAWLAGTMQFETPTIVEELSEAMSEANISLADDDLTVFFARPALVLVANDIYRATRPSTLVAFTAPERVDALSSMFTDGRISFADGGGFGVLASDRSGGAGQSDLWSTTRTNAGFSPPSQKLVEALNTSQNQFDPEVAPDGLTIYYSQTAFGGQDLMVATRATTTVAFEPGTRLSIAGAGPVLSDPTLSPDGRVIVFSSGTAAADLDLYVATRPSAKAAFGNAQRLAVSSPETDADPELARDGCALLFASNRPEAAARDVWVARVRAPGSL